MYFLFWMHTFPILPPVVAHAYTLYYTYHSHLCAKTYTLTVPFSPRGKLSKSVREREGEQGTRRESIWPPDPSILSY